MRDDQPALHDAVGFQLALDADRVILREVDLWRNAGPDR